MSKFLFAPLLTVAACASTGQYVANIRAVPRGIEVQKCSFDDRGKADTGICQTETVMIRAAAAPQPPAAPLGYLQPGAPGGTRSTPEHFFCAGAGTMSICTRNFASCNLARDEVLSQSDQIDMRPCESAERVWCFDREPGAEQCFADRGACLARAARAFPEDATCDERM